MMQRFWSWLAVNLARHAGIVTAIGLVFTIVIGFGITRLEFATGQDSYLNADSQVYKDNVAYQDLFGGEAMLTGIAMTNGETDRHDLHPRRDPATARRRDRPAGDRRRQGRHLAVDRPGVLGLVGAVVRRQPAQLDRLQGARRTRRTVAEQAGDTASLEARQADFGKTAERLLAIPTDQQTLDNPEWVKFLLYDNQGEVRKALRTFFPDETHAQIITRLEGNQSIKVQGVASDGVVGVTSNLDIPGTDTVTTGAPVLLKSINDYLQGGMLTLGGIAVAVMIVILLLFFNVRWRLLPLAVVLVGIIWAFGATGFLGIPLTLVTIAGLPVMLGIGIDYAIQMHSRIEEEVIIDASPHPIQAAARGLGPALLVVTFDAVFAFLAIQLSQVPMVRQFGWLLTVGIIAICISSIINPLAILGIREYRSPTKGKDFSEGRLGRFVVWLGKLPPSTAIGIAVVSVAIFAIGSWLEPSLKLESDPINWVNQDSPRSRDIRELQDEYGRASEMGLYVVATDGRSLFDQPTIDFVDTFSPDLIERNPEVLERSNSIVATVADLTDIPGAAHVTPKAELVKAAWDVAPNDVQISSALARRDRPERRVPDQAGVARGPGGRGQRRPRQRRSTPGDPGDAVRSRGGRRRAPGEPGGKPGSAHLAGRRPRVPLPRWCDCVRSSGRSCRWSRS